MRKFLGVVFTILTVLAITAMAADKSLSDRQLATVTAGHNFETASGAIAAGNSEQTITTNTGVTLGDGAQAHASGMNIANTAGGQLAQGINVWSDGALTGPALSDPRHDHDKDSVIGYALGFDIKQVNIIKQTAPVSAGASLDSYKSDGSLYMRDPKLEIYASHKSGEFGYISDDYLKVSNTFDKFVGLKGAFDYHSDASTNLGAGFCLVCNTYDKFKLTYNDLDAGYAEFENDKFGFEFKADAFAWRGPIHLRDAEAEYIAVDDSKQTIDITNAVSLGSDAQSYASGMNIVNAANSLVAQAANVASSAGGATNLSSFKQVNVIIQK